MREERQEEESREQKGLEQHEQQSSVTLLTVICRPHTRTQTHKYSQLMYTHTQKALDEHTFALCATLRAIRRPLPLSSHEGSRHNANALTRRKPTYLLPISSGRTLSETELPAVASGV